MTRPVDVIVVARIASDMVNVWIDDVHNNSESTPSRCSPSRRIWRVSATTTSSRLQRRLHKDIRRYITVTGTLRRLWQRQNDVSSAPAAQRRTTAASPTRAAANSPRPLLPTSRKAVPLSRGTRKRPRFLGGSQARNERRRGRGTDLVRHSATSSFQDFLLYRPSCSRRSAPAPGSVATIKKMLWSTLSMKTYGSVLSKSNPPPDSCDGPASIVFRI